MGYSAWRTPDSGYAIRCCGLGKCYDGSTGWPAGAFLAEYDPEANDGHGEMWWTEDVNGAISFADIEGAIECYRAIPANRPVREDGKPNCPLTVFTIEFVELPNPRPFDPANDRHHLVSAPVLAAELHAKDLLDEDPPPFGRRMERGKVTRVDGAVLADCLFLIGQALVKRNTGNVHGADEDVAAAMALMPDGSVELIMSLIEAGDLPAPSGDPDAMDGWLEACRQAGADALTLTVTERPAPPKARAPYPRQAESEADFLKRLSQIRADAEARQVGLRPSR